MKNCFKIIYIFLFLLIYPSFLLANLDGPNPTEDIKENEVLAKDNSIEFIIELINKGDYENSKKILMEKIKDNKNDEHALNLLGYVERQLQNYLSAINYYKAALFINNEYIAAHHYIIIAYLEIDKLDKAREHRDYLDLLCLFGCIEFTEANNAIKMYEANNVK